MLEDIVEDEGVLVGIGAVSTVAAKTGQERATGGAIGHGVEHGGAPVGAEVVTAVVAVAAYLLKPLLKARV